MPPDLQTIADPRFILMAWAGGLAASAAVVAWLGIVGRGFTWLAAGTTLVVGVSGVFEDGATWARVAIGAVAIGTVAASNRRLSGSLLAVGGVAFVWVAGVIGGWLPAVTAALALGGVTSEMMLGHWYLIDPRLPRWALRGLAIAGIVGLAADSLLLASIGEMPGGGSVVAFWVLSVTSVVLMVAVLAAIRHPAYSGVMAATGLSYLAVLTSLGAVFLGRALIAGVGPLVG